MAAFLRAWRYAGAFRRRLRAGRLPRFPAQPPRPAPAGTLHPGSCMTAFDRDSIRVFRFVRCGFDPATGVAELAYAFDDGPELVETVTIPGAPFTLDPTRAAAVEQALRLLHLVAGVSYYKAAVPPRIAIDGPAIAAATAALLPPL